MTFVQRSKKDVWQTPDDIWGPIDERDTIDLDPCAGEDTTIGETNYTVEDDGLSSEWFGTVWMNPPFSQKERWFERLREQRHNIERAYVVTPDSTDVKSWWHGQVVELARYTWFPEGRIRYVDPDTGEKANSPSFGSAVSVVKGGQTNVTLPSSVADWMRQNGDLVRRVYPNKRLF